MSRQERMAAIVVSLVSVVVAVLAPPLGLDAADEPQPQLVKELGASFWLWQLPELPSGGCETGGAGGCPISGQ